MFSFFLMHGFAARIFPALSTAFQVQRPRMTRKREIGVMPVAAIGDCINCKDK